MKVTNLHISCNYFPFLVCQRGVQLLYKTLDTLIENSAVLQSDSFGFVDRQTYKSKDQALKQHRCLRRKNNFSGYRRPNNFLLPQFAVKELHLEIFSQKISEVFKAYFQKCISVLGILVALHSVDCESRGRYFSQYANANASDRVFDRVVRLFY